MQPVHKFSGWITNDLTKCEVHKITDKYGRSRVVVMAPATWEKWGEKTTMIGANGKPMSVQNYSVLTWEECKMSLPEPRDCAAARLPWLIVAAIIITFAWGVLYTMAGGTIS